MQKRQWFCYDINWEDITIIFFKIIIIFNSKRYANSFWSNSNAENKFTENDNKKAFLKKY